MNKGRLLRLLSVLIVLMLIFSSCASHKGRNKWLSSSKDQVSSSWETYNQALDNYNKIEIGMLESEVKKFNIYDGSPTTMVRSWDYIYKMFEYAIKGKMEKILDQGLLEFINAGGNRGKVLEVDIVLEKKHGEGSLIANALSFLKITKTTGYKFTGRILLVDGIVVYIFGPEGKPIEKVRQEKNPLGPLNNIDGDSTVKTFKNLL